MSNFVIDTPVIVKKLDQEALLTFLDHTVLMITQASNAEEVDLLMDDFMSEDIIQLFSDNRELFSLLNAVWLNTFKRVFIDERSESFPLKVLWLPVLFKELNWVIEDIETFEEASFHLKVMHHNKQDLYYFLVELFMNGLKFEPETALNLFKQKLEKLSVSDCDREKIQTMVQEIEELGW